MTESASTRAEIIFREIYQDMRRETSFETGLLNAADEPKFRDDLRKKLATKDSVVKKRVEDEFFEWGAIDTLISNPEITEIVINGHRNIWFEKQGHFEKHWDHFFSTLTFQNFITRVCQEAGVSANLQHPFASGRWRDFRLQLVAPPIATENEVLCLRRQDSGGWNFNRLQQAHWAGAHAIAHMESMVTKRKCFIVVGPTGCGKTSVIDSCLQLVAANERVILIEDTDELKVPNDCSSKLVTRTDPTEVLNNFNLSDLVKHSLRLRPDRLVIGEVRGGEAKDMLMALATGHKGGITSLHAEGAHQALLRLEMMIQLGAPQWNLQTVRRLIQFSLDSIVVLKFTGGKRMLEGIYKITSLEETGFLLERVI